MSQARVHCDNVNILYSITASIFLAATTKSAINIAAKQAAD